MIELAKVEKSFGSHHVIKGFSASVRKGLRSKFHALLHRCRQRKSLRVVA